MEEINKFITLYQINIMGDVLSFRQHLPAGSTDMLRHSPSLGKGHPFAQLAFLFFG